MPHRARCVALPAWLESPGPKRGRPGRGSRFVVHLSPNASPRRSAGKCAPRAPARKWFFPHRRPVPRRRPGNVPSLFACENDHVAVPPLLAMERAGSPPWRAANPRCTSSPVGTSQPAAPRRWPAPRAGEHRSVMLVTDNRVPSQPSWAAETTEFEGADSPTGLFLSPGRPICPSSFNPEFYGQGMTGGGPALEAPWRFAGLACPRNKNDLPRDFFLPPRPRRSPDPVRRANLAAGRADPCPKP